MNYLGDFAPGSEVYVWFNTFTSDDPSVSVTATDLIDTDIVIYKDDSLTQRANAAGTAIDIDVDTFPGVHKFTIDTADNTVGDFWEAGHDYACVAVGITVDAGTINAVVATFSIANRRTAGQMAQSSIEGLVDQDTFTLTAGEVSADNDAYNDCLIVITDQVTKIQKAVGYISDYTGASRTVQLYAAPLQTAFTMAIGDSVEIFATSAFSNVHTWNRTAVTSGTGGPDVNVNAVSDDTTAAATLELFVEVLDQADGQIDAGTFHAGAVDASALNADAATEIGNAVWDTDATGRQTAGTFGQAIGDPAANAETMYDAVVTDATGTNVAVDINAVKAETVLIVADTNELQTDDYPTSIAAIKAETALIVADTNELQTDDYPTSIAAVQTTADAIEVAVIDNAAGADIAADIIAIKAETADIVADTNELQVDDYPTSIAAVKAETALIVADTNMLQTDWVNGGRLDNILDAAGGAGDPWLTALPGGYAGGTAGNIIGNNLDADISGVETKIDTIDTNVDQIETAVITNAAGVDIAADIIALKAETVLIVADTNELQVDDTPAAIAAAVADIAAVKAETALIVADTNELQTDDTPAAIAAVKAETALIVADTNELQTDDTPAAIAALNNISTADVNAQVLDVLNVDVFAEPGQENPAATASLVTKISYLYKLMRNKIETTAAQISIYNDAGAVVDQKAAINDDGVTFDRGEFGTGP